MVGLAHRSLLPSSSRLPPHGPCANRALIENAEPAVSHRMVGDHDFV